MHELRRAHDLAAERLAEGLVAEADAEERHRRAADELEADPRLVGRARPRRDHDPLGPERERLVDAHRVVADDLHVGPELAEVLVEVEGERVVVVDEEDHARPPATRAPRRAPGPSLRSRAPRRPGRSRPRCRRRSGAWPCRPAGGACGWRCRSRGCRRGRCSRGPRRRARGPSGSSSSMICIARIFGRAGERPRREGRGEGVERVLPLLELPHHRAHDVGHVAVVLDLHQLRHLHAAEAAHAAEVVAAEVHEHEVLGPLLLVGQQLARDRVVVPPVVARARARRSAASRRCFPSTRTSISGRGAGDLRPRRPSGSTCRATGSPCAARGRR